MHNRRKPRGMDVSISIAITLGSPRPLLKSIFDMTARKMESDESSSGQFSYHTKTFGRKNNRNNYSQALHCGLSAQGMDIRKWNGAARTSFEWDELRRVSTLVFLWSAASNICIGFRLVVQQWRLSCLFACQRAIPKSSEFPSPNQSSDGGRC